jgi:hypothetical protein
MRENEGECKTKPDFSATITVETILRFPTLTLVMKLLFCAVLIFCLPALCAGFASDIQKMNDAELKPHAAETVARLHDTMLDPASFVLDNVFVSKPNKRGKVSICYAFRSHNAMGGYAEARAVEDGDDNNRLSVFKRDNGYGKFQGYDVGWIAPCKDKNIDREITADVMQLAPPLYKKSR